MREGLKKGLIILTVCALSLGALVVSGLYLLELDVDTSQNGESNELLSVLPDGKHFKALELDGRDFPESVREVYTEDGGAVAVKLSVTGYAADMVVLCGIDADGTVVGATCISSNETLGREKTYGETVVGVNSESVDALTTVAGATKTTRGYNKAVKDALEVYRILSEGGDSIETGLG